MATVVVTDSTASLPARLAAENGIVVVPLQVVIGSRSYDDGVDPEADPAHVAAALRDFVPVSTSRVNPVEMRRLYVRLARQGADGIVSVHLSGELSGTVESAAIAARDAPVPVAVVDTRLVAAGVGYAALAAAEVAAAGGSPEEAAVVARDRAAACTALFCVDTLEYLRRGGRVGTAAALLGSALAIKPILTFSGGAVRPLEKVRTSTRALARLEELAVSAAGTGPVAMSVMHLANQPAADRLDAALRSRLADQLVDDGFGVSEIGAVLGAHAGPGLVGVVVCRRS
jgi:DegV family protein with EDD domain